MSDPTFVTAEQLENAAFHLGRAVEITQRIRRRRLLEAHADAPDLDRLEQAILEAARQLGAIEEGENA